MKKVYVVTEGSYSDYHIRAVFSSKENAQLYVDKAQERDLYDFLIEEYDLDENVKEMRKGFLPFYVVMKIDGSTKNLQQMSVVIPSGYQSSSTTEFKYTINREMVLSCWARDAKHAVKICNDVRVQEIASGRFGINPQK